MRAHEFITENTSVASTSSGSIATVAQPLGGVITRNGGNFFTGTKYMNSADPYPNTPAYMKKGKKSRAR
jgi:hypothetical protein